ncbi:MAG: glycosyltransferase [Flavobacteriales bacterium]|nr:glycosyltransferase [Flavobacteriales bacterium]
MAQRKQVGFVFSYNESWIGGTYYILNIIHALHALPDEEKPVITILSSKKEDFELVKKETNYPYLDYRNTIVESSLKTRLVNKVSRIFLSKNLLSFTKLRIKNIDMVYPRYSPKFEIRKSSKKVFWIPDFQDMFLPQYFPQEELTQRENDRIEISKTEGILVTSSKDAQNHFNKTYTTSKPQQFILQFAVTHPSYNHINIDELKKIHKLPAQYYFAPNQFWAHKNHISIIKAVKRLKDSGLSVTVAFSGKESDYRNQDHIDKLKELIVEYELQKNILFLGFLDRKVQLQLMKNSMAIIQPSLFEGWSTVVEDAKSLNKHIILSNLSVHREQTSINCTFFDAENDEKLADILEIFEPDQEIETDYSQNIVNFGKNFNKLIGLAS